ncbi:CRISPR-associated protein Cas1 [Nitrosococcus halophilus Nc 4]|uniref:CRISPR-associated endonuclease Cas1 n=1 Tax=Nitrosococcus halophilus (strain Nc4) TaxID=472759 RepID=D5BYK2_NITHN|nr:CRISPR-associated endonuclease Cas1 [Nitrosococcus halophilus]ADE15990.1 CRISPR-associated protein Cas1 [Nitrosococcus halophilus Nc 4]
METLFVSREARLRRRENTLSITIEGKTRAFPIETIGHLVLLAESTLNSKLLTLCGKHGVRLSVFDYYGYFKGSFEPFNRNPSGQVKLAQAEILLNETQRMALARELVRGAAHNMQANLLYYRYRGKTGLEAMLKEMKRLVNLIPKAQDSSTLMGIEGNLHQWYYKAWKLIDPVLDFTPRVRRPPNNPINCLLSFLNQLTYTIVRHELFKTHLEETFSLLHSPGNGRSSLSLDLAEPFKPILADSLIFRMLGRKMLDASWFEQYEGVCLLSETGRRNIAEQFSIRLEERYQDRSFREWIYREALAIERHFLGVAEYESFKRKV